MMRDVFLLLGIGLVAYGLWLVYLPLAFIFVGGIIMVATIVNWVCNTRSDTRSPDSTSRY